MPKAVFIVFSCLLLLPLGNAQEAALPRVPSLIKHSGVLKDRLSNPVHDIVGLTFLIYKDREGGTPLWMETQNVNPEADGKYSAILGATKDLPLDLFAGGEPRWVGVQINLPGEDEQPRVQLVSVPYALKAAEAETLGGLPLSAFVLTPQGAQKAGGPMASTVLPTAAVSGTGTANQLTKWMDNFGLLGDSAVAETGGNVAVGAAVPHALLDVGGFDYAHSNSPTVGIQRNASASYSTTNMLSGGSALALTASQNDLSKVVALQLMDFNANGAIGLTYDSTQKGSLVFGTSNGGGDPAPVIERMRITGDGNVGIGTPNPSQRLDVASGNLGLGANLKTTNQILKAFTSNHSPDNVPAELDVLLVDGGEAGMKILSFRDLSNNFNNQSLEFWTHHGGVSVGPRLKIDQDGNVGIGIANPIQRLEVAGGIKFTSGVLTFPDGTTQTSACGILFSANGRAGRPDSVTPAGGGAMSECSAAASLQQVVQEQRSQIQRLQSEVESLKQRLDALVAAKPGGRQ